MERMEIVKGIKYFDAVALQENTNKFEVWKKLESMPMSQPTESQKKKKVLVNATSLTILQLFNYIAPLVLLPYLTRTLAVEEFGAVMVALASCQFAYVFTDYGFSLSANYAISRNRDDKNYINHLIGRIFTAKILLLLFACTALVTISALPPYKEHQTIFFAGLAAVAAQAYQPIWFFHGLEKMKNFTIYMALTKVFYVALVLLLVRQAGEGTWVLASWSAANIAGTIIAVTMLKRMGFKAGFSNFKAAFNELRTSAQYFWSRLAVALYTSASSVVVGTADMAQAAMFTSAEQGYKACQNITTPINQSMFPYMARESNWHFFLKVVSTVTVFMIIASWSVWYWGEFFVTLVFGPNYTDAVPVLRIFMVTLVINYLGISFGYPACAAIGRPDIANKTVYIGAALYLLIIASLFFLNQVSAIYIASAIFLTELCVMILRIMWVATSVFYVDKNVIPSQALDLIEND